MKRRSEVGDREPKRPPTIQIPHDAINEVVMIAAVIVDKTAAEKYLEAISPDHFFGSGHAVTWAALQVMRRKGLSYDPATMHDLSGGKIDTAAIEG